jgi:NAD(P)-dependent dehydrogenase (short-subunit alcohol dehydrogenase family)
MSTPQDMKGKVCLITGATQGIGLAAAIDIAKHGPTMVLVARDPKRGEAAVAEVKEKSGNPGVELMLADLASLASIRRLADTFKAKYDRLHVLINNAGAIAMQRSLTEDGYETTFAVNHLAYFLLTNLLLDVMKASAPARIINVSSEAQRQGTINFDDLHGERRYSGMRAYGQSKLANVLFTYELARRLQGTGVTANCLHPGVVATGFGRNNSGIFKLLVQIASPFLLTPEKGARTTVYLATSPEVEGVTGKYFDKSREKKSIPESYDLAIAKRLWEVSEELTRPREPAARVA